MTVSQDHEGYRAIFAAALTGICANPSFFGAIFQQSPRAAVDFATEVVAASCAVTSGQPAYWFAFSGGDMLRDDAGEARRFLTEAEAQSATLIFELLAALKGLSVILSKAESNASGNPEWEYVRDRVNAARAAVAKAEGK